METVYVSKELVREKYYTLISPPRYYNIQLHEVQQQGDITHILLVDYGMFDVSWSKRVIPCKSLKEAEAEYERICRIKERKYIMLFAS